MNLDYNNNISILINEIGWETEEIYKFQGTPGEDEYFQSFKFCQEALILNKKYGIYPNIFFFRNNSKIDAKAIKKDKYYIIWLNKGIIDLFNRYFVTYFYLDEIDELNKYSSLESQLIDSIGKLMYQSTLHFTFYHELGHLIQFVEKPDLSIAESLNTKAAYSIIKHSEEIDADLFSSICLSTHFYQYFEDYYQGKIDEDSITNYLSILTSTMFIYFLSFDDCRSGFYLKEHSHPHPLIRILSSINTIIGYFKEIMEKKGIISVRIERNKVFAETFRIAEIFIKKFFGESNFLGFNTLLRENLVEIKNYHSELVSEFSSNPNSATNRRNENI